MDGMWGIDTRELAQQYGLLVFFLPLLPSLATAGAAQWIVRPGPRAQMAGLSLATTFGSFGAAAALLPLMDNLLPREFLRWEGYFILLLPVFVTLFVAVQLRNHGGSWLQRDAQDPI
jgi:membrane associated rhomboid family serine protease